MMPYTTHRSTQTRGLTAGAMLAALPIVLVVAACGKKPGGQVVAVVNGQEVTQQELRVEAEANNINPQNLAGASPGLVDRIIQRNLLADYARSQGLDRSPEYVTRRRLLEQTLLSSLALRKIVGTPPKPTPAEVQQFIAANPASFAGRARLTLDQLRFPTPADPSEIGRLTALGSLTAIENKLRGENKPVARGNTTVDTATLDPGVARQIAGLPDGRVFDLSVGGTTFVSTITGRTPTATPPATWTDPATALLQRQRAERTVAQTIEKLRKDAKIDYDPAFKPKAAAPTTVTPPK